MENIAKLNHFGEDVSNSELVKKSQLGDKSAFEELVKRHQELVFSLSFKYFIEVVNFSNNALLEKYHQRKK